MIIIFYISALPTHWALSSNAETHLVYIYTGCLKKSVPVFFMNSQKITQQAKLAKKWNIYGLNYYLFIKNENWGFEKNMTILGGTQNFMSVEFCLKSKGLAYIKVESVVFIRFVWSKMLFKADIKAKILLFTELNYLEYH